MMGEFDILLYIHCYVSYALYICVCRVVCALKTYNAHRIIERIKLYDDGVSIYGMGRNEIPRVLSIVTKNETETRFGKPLVVYCFGYCAIGGEGEGKTFSFPLTLDNTKILIWWVSHYEIYFIIIFSSSFQHI